ncbi:MAG: hypothetical protein U0229_25145 [Anaeromyxobacter sp.]
MALALPLTALLLATATPAWAPVEVQSGEGDVPVRVSLDLLTKDAPAAPPRPLVWSTSTSGAAVGTARGEGWTARVVFGRPEAGARTIDVTIRWLGAAGLERAALRLGWPAGDARAVGTDLALAAVERPRRVGRGTPILATGGGLVLTGGEGFEAARYEAPGGRALEVSLYLDDARDRPFSTYPSCLDRLPEPSTPGGAITFGALERRDKVLDVDRRPGDVDRAHAVLSGTATNSRFVPLVPERWPRGARAAFVITDHADRSDAPALRALLWGSSKPEAMGRPGQGLLGRGLKITKSFFVTGPDGSLTDPAIQPLAAALQAAGSEVALHSISPGKDDRAAVAIGLGLAAPWGPVTWIDHEPYTNCEAIATAGWQAGGTYGVRDLLVRAGFRWVWSAGDVAGFMPAADGGRAEVIDVFGDGDGPPPIYPLPMDPRLWAFESTFFYAEPGDLAAALSDAALARLEARRGLFVGHTYLGAGLSRTHGGEHEKRLVVRPAGAGEVELDPALDGAFRRLQRRVAAGTLASLTWAEAGDRLRALGGVELTYRKDGAAEVRNTGEVALDGLTLAVPEEGLEVTANGSPLPRADAPGSTRAWLDLAPGGRAVVRLWRGVTPVPFLVPP